MVGNFHNDIVTLLNDFYTYVVVVPFGMHPNNNEQVRKAFKIWFFENSNGIFSEVEKALNRLI